MVLFPGLTQLDLTGPYDVLARLPDTAVHLVAASLDSVESETGLRIVPTTTFSACPDLDVLLVPGGLVAEAMEDEELLAFLRTQGAQAGYVTAVCTGSLILGAAGLLRGYQATTHWGAREVLARLGAEPVPARVVVDRNRVTGGGVTSGIDFALRLAAILKGEEVARRIQLFLEYDPEPPFDSGSPDRAHAETVAAFREFAAPSLATFEAAADRAAERFPPRRDQLTS